MIVTHNGRFHVDELFSIAILAKFILHVNVRSLKIIRTRNDLIIKKYQEDEFSYVIDVGEKFESKLNNYDHHQVDPNLIWEKQFIEDERINKPILMSACGLMWKECLDEKHKVLEKFGIEVVEKINIIAQKVDLCDSGTIPWSLTPIFSRYNSLNFGVEEENKCFRNALLEVEKFINNIISGNIEEERIVENKIMESFEKFVKQHKINEETELEMRSLLFSGELKMIVDYISLFGNKNSKEKNISINNFLVSLKNRANITIEGKAVIYAAYSESLEEEREEIVLFYDRCYDARIVLTDISKKALLYATYYSDSDEWVIMSVNKYKDDPYTGRILMPKEWAGKRGAELESVSGFKGMFYAHKLRFLVIVKGVNEDHVINVCKKIIELSK